MTNVWKIFITTIYFVVCLNYHWLLLVVDKPNYGMSRKVSSSALNLRLSSTLADILL